jgi:hypothetical protein
MPFRGNVSAIVTKYAPWSSALLLIACAAGHTHRDPEPTRITLPLQAAWYDDQRVYYITTDITDPAMAEASGVTYAPRLRDAVPAYPKPPEVKSVLERVYKFPGGEQDPVFASAPHPVGPRSTDESYSPLWLLYTVRWNATAHVHTLTSEETLLHAESRGEISSTRTHIVINCPIVATAAGSRLGGTTISP